MGFTSFLPLPNPAAAGVMGLGTCYPPPTRWEQPAVHDRLAQVGCRFGRSSQPELETSVSYLLLTTVQAQVHITFPVPFSFSSPCSLVQQVGPTRVRPVCVSTGRLTAAPHIRIAPDARAVKDASFQRRFRRKQDSGSGNASFQSTARSEDVTVVTVALLATKYPPRGNISGHFGGFYPPN